MHFEKYKISQKSTYLKTYISWDKPLFHSAPRFYASFVKQYVWKKIKDKM
jgi:hypothetical protein